MPKRREDFREHVVAFGQRLRELREDAGLSQEALAHAAGVERAEVGFIERAEREPGISIVVPLAKALGVEPGSSSD